MLRLRLFCPVVTLALVATLHSGFPMAAPVQVPVVPFTPPTTYDTLLPPDPAPVPAPPVDPPLPALTLTLAANPSVVSVGETVVVTLTLTNAADVPDDDLRLTLPLPDGVAVIRPWNPTGPFVPAPHVIVSSDAPAGPPPPDVTGAPTAPPPARRPRGAVVGAPIRLATPTGTALPRPCCRPPTSLAHPAHPRPHPRQRRF
jgi:hypothetical protein